MDENNTSLAVIFGAFLGFLATLFSAQITSYFQRRAKTKAHIIYLRLELSDVLKSLDTIRTGHEHQRFYDYLYLDILDISVKNLQNARLKTYLIKDDKIQEEIFSLINRVTTLARDIRGIQDYSYSKSNLIDQTTGLERPMTEIELSNKEKLIKDKTANHMIEIVDLKREVKNLQDKL